VYSAGGPFVDGGSYDVNNVQKNRGPEVSFSGSDVKSLRDAFKNGIKSLRPRITGEMIDRNIERIYEGG
jgi:hypothetical protein